MKALAVEVVDPVLDDDEEEAIIGAIDGEKVVEEGRRTLDVGVGI